MSLITPDFGLLFWMVIIFGLVLFLLSKFGFPVITSMVDKRSEHIAESLKKAEEAEQRLANMAQEQAKMMEETKLEHSRILQEATQARDRIIASAKVKAEEEAAKIIEHAKVEIATQKEEAMREIAHQTAVISMQVAEKILRKELDKSQAQIELVDKMVEETRQAENKIS
ncbi:MAG: F0F1 ATP synthase subunit B [Bacteroidales bacterium]|nr:F0F1 ATP synthase subunit B [Bacteroidales bacterium]MBQ5582825.1 F0F1 ATP synthase subunit B [Bacteroidales bacterium]